MHLSELGFATFKTVITSNACLWTAGPLTGPVLGATCAPTRAGRKTRFSAKKGTRAEEVLGPRHTSHKVSEVQLVNLKRNFFQKVDFLIRMPCTQTASQNFRGSQAREL